MGGCFQLSVWICFYQAYSQPYEENLVQAIKTLHEGGIVAHPTETCYGLAADIFKERAQQTLSAQNASR